ncbi:MAG: penicillin-insensitive murein endopeptidase, partial [Polyangiales bacterium]
RDPTRWPGARKLPRRSHSIGYPWMGKLRRGVRLQPSRYVGYVSEYRKDGRFFGTWELVQLLERAAWRVARRHPGAKLYVGELSKAGGGEVPGHASHENGRDVDIAFYLRDARGKPLRPRSFIHIRRDGSARAPHEGVRFDDARNWELVAKLVADGDAKVQRIFVGAAIRRRLLDYARQHNAPQVLLERAAQVMVQPAQGHPHRNHFHVRIYCPPSDRPACKDRAPFYPWYPQDTMHADAKH